MAVFFFYYVIGDDRFVDWQEVKEVKLIDVKAIGGDGSTIKLADDSAIFIDAGNYSNMSSIRQSLKHHITQRKSETADPILLQTPSPLRANTVTTFAGNP